MLLYSLTSAQQHIPAGWSVVTQIPASQGMREQPGLAGGICGVHQHMLIIAGGSNFPDSLPWEGGKKKYHQDIFALDLTTGSGYPWLYAASDTLPRPLAYSACTSAPDGVISVGGENEQGPVSTVLLLRWDAVSKKVTITSLPDYPYEVTNAAAAYAGGNIYVAGGETRQGVTKGFYALRLDAMEKGWQKLPDLPAATSHMILLAQSVTEHLFLIGGRRKDPSGVSELYRQVYSFDPTQRLWRQKRSLPYPLSAGTGVASGKDDIFIFGGDKGEIFHRVELLLKEIAQEKDPVKKQELTVRKNELQIHHPGFSHELLAYRIHLDKWKRAGNLDFTIPVTTTACKLDHTIIIAGGEIRAGVRSAQVITGTLQ